MLLKTQDRKEEFMFETSVHTAIEELDSKLIRAIITTKTLAQTTRNDSEKKRLLQKSASLTEVHAIWNIIEIRRMSENEKLFTFMERITELTLKKNLTQGEVEGYNLAYNYAEKIVK